MDIFCVGGSVRDFLLGRPAGDTDYTVLGCTDTEFQRAFPRARKVGRTHPVYLFKGRQYTVSPALSIDRDLHNRDLTVNALAIDPLGYLYAHPQALSDLVHRILRPVAEQNFFDDPLRVVRAARFKAGLPGFRLLPGLHHLLRRVASSGLLDQVAAERVGREVHLACQSAQPGHFVRVLAASSTLGPWLVELERTDWKATAKIMDRVAGKEQRVWMALVHACTDPGAGCPVVLKPDVAAGSVASEMGRRLCLPKQMIGAGRLAATWQQAASRYPALEASLRVRLLMEVHTHRIMDAFWTLITAITGEDLIDQTHSDLQTILNIHLPPAWQGLGRRSGEYLHYLRCRALEGKETRGAKKG
ncbi:MAG: tRNA nucleotidyltransferase [Desulfovermiculus sp.]|nr:tRNA nucleotidyltransferase [Desulfovermiculus sp.]